MSEEKEDTKPKENGGQPDEGQEAVEASKAANLDDDDLGGVLGDEDGADFNDEAMDDIDSLINEIDPGFKDELNQIGEAGFGDHKISESQSELIDDQQKIPPAWKSFLKNLPREQKITMGIAAGVILVFFPIIFFLLSGHLIPNFEFPYKVRMDEMTSKIYSYPTDEAMVPLFDDFRSNAFTITLPGTTINLKPDGDQPAYGKFEFFLNLREKDLAKVIKKNEREIMDLLQRTLEQVTWRELQSPVGKEKVKRVLRSRINSHLEANHVLGVYYRSILLSK